MTLQPADSIQYYKAVLDQHAPEQYMRVAHYELALALNSVGKHEEAMVHLKNCELHPPVASVLPLDQIYKALSECLSAMGKVADAETYSHLAKELRESPIN